MSGYLKLPIVSAGGSGDLVGPASATDSAVALFDTTTGKLLKDSKVVVDSDGRISQTGLLTSTYVGKGAGVLDDLTTNYNTGFGEDALAVAITSAKNVGIGYSSLSSVGHILGADNVGVGYTSGMALFAGKGSVFLGSGAGNTCTNGNYNISIGNSAAGTNITGSSNVCIGHLSGFGVGAQNHSFNTFIGDNTGRSVSTGSSNILLGVNVDLPTATTSNHLNIGDTIYGDISTTKIGIGEVAPAGTLHTNQASTTAAIPALVVEQGDIDDTFINFIGTSAADGTRSISSDTTEDSAKFGAIRVEINGTTKWIRIYDNES